VDALAPYNFNDVYCTLYLFFLLDVVFYKSVEIGFEWHMLNRHFLRQRLLMRRHERQHTACLWRSASAAFVGTQS